MTFATLTGATILMVGLGTVVSSCTPRRAVQDVQLSAATDSAARMPDGRLWMRENLNVDVSPSYCYDDREANCRVYGRLYTGEAALRACRSFGLGFRLPTNDEWRQLAKHYGGVRDDSDDTGKAAYAALTSGGDSGFNAVKGGGRTVDGQYTHLDAHGFYWTVSQSTLATAWFYNFGRARFLNRHADGEKGRALSVRCVRERWDD